MYIRFLQIIILLISLQGHGQNSVSLVGFTPSECNDDEEYWRLRRRIINQWFTNDTLHVELASTATCCVDFKPSIDFNTNILDIRFEETGDFCECICCYQFIYHITGLQEREFITHLNGKPIQQSDEAYLTYPIRFDIYKGDTINYVDKYGFRQGLFLSESKDETPPLKMVYKDNKPYNGIRRVRYYENGNKKFAEMFKNGDQYFITYYLNNQVEEECMHLELSNSRKGSIAICNTYDSLGNFTRRMDDYPFGDQSKYSKVLVVFKDQANSIFIKTGDKESINVIDSLDLIPIKEGDRILVSYEKYSDKTWIQNIREYFLDRNVLNVKFNEFEKKSSLYDDF